MRYIILIFFLFAVSANATTYYVREAGNDGSAGTAWNTAWATLGKVDDNLSKGDTVLFGKGTYYGDGDYIAPPGGIGAAVTVYACSTFQSGQSDSITASKNLARIRSGEIITGWTQHAGNVYKAFWNPSGGYADPPPDNNCQTLVNEEQDTIFIEVGSLGNIDEAGEFYHKISVDSLYAWNFGGGDPDNDTIYASVWPVVWLFPDSRYIKFVGLDLQGGKQGVVVADDVAFGDIHFIHCHMAKCGHATAENPAIIFTEASSSATDWLIQSCSLGMGVTEGSDISDAFNHGGTTDFFSTDGITIESCYVYGVGANGILFKANNDNITVRYNTIVSNGGTRGMNMHRNADNIEMYGNLFIGNFSEAAVSVGGGEGTNGMLFYNNTIVNNNGYNIHIGNMDNDFAGSFTGTAEIKYNLVYNYGLSGDNPLNSKVIGYDHRNCSGCDIVIDSNAYYSVTTAEFQCSGNANDTWTAWQSGGDCNEDGLSHDPTIDFWDGGGSPTYALPDTTSLLMDSTYGGRNWTVYGAVQQDAERRVAGQGHWKSNMFEHHMRNAEDAQRFLVGCKVFTFKIQTRGDADGEYPDSVYFHIDSLFGAPHDFRWGIYNLDWSPVIFQKNATSVTDTGFQVQGNWDTTNAVSTLSNYTEYWLMGVHDAENTNANHIRMNIADVHKIPWHLTFLVDGSNCLSVAYDGSMPDSETVTDASPINQGTGNEMGNCYITYQASTPDNDDSLTYSIEFDQSIPNDTIAVTMNFNNDFDSVFLTPFYQQTWACATPTRFGLLGKHTFTTNGQEIKIGSIPNNEGGNCVQYSVMNDPSPNNLAWGMPIYFYSSVYFNDFLFYHDTVQLFRLPSLWTQFETDTVTNTHPDDADSFNLWGHMDTAGSVAPTQLDTIIIGNGDVVHVINKTFINTNDVEYNLGSAHHTDGMFSANFDTTFAHLSVETGGTFKMWGGQRVNILTHNIVGGVTMTATDTIGVWSDGSIILSVGSFGLKRKLKGWKN